MNVEKTNSRYQYLLEFRKSDRKWHFPFLASLCVGICLLIGYFTGKPNYGSTACLGALTILYFTNVPLSQRMIHMAVCAFGFIFSFSICSFLSFNVYLAATALGIVAFLAHFISTYFKIPPPGNFFFIMVGAMAGTHHFNLEMIPTRVGLVAMGAMLSCSMAFLYSVFIEKNVLVQVPRRRKFNKKRYTHFVESAIIAVFVGLTLVVGHLLSFENNYWITISLIAIIQGRNFEHVRQRNIQRILATFIGVGIAWGILYFHPNKLVMILFIVLFQFLIEMLIVRNYGSAVVFMTPLTILLAETGSIVPHNFQNFIHDRFIDTIIGSLMGVIAGYVLHHQELINNLEKKVRFSFFQFKKLKK